MDTLFNGLKFVLLDFGIAIYNTKEKNSNMVIGQLNMLPMKMT